MNTTTTPDRWITERRALMAREKELMRLHDQVAEERRALPWVRIDKNYTFDTPSGRKSLADLFGGRRQLMVQHFMFGPGWAEGCPSCSYMADHADGMNMHLANRDISFVAVSRATLAEIEQFKQRMGWKFDWVSSASSDFNYDFHVSFSADERAGGEVQYNFGPSPARGEEAPGISVFYKDDSGAVYRTYSTFGRGVEVMMGAYQLMDLTPEGRGERDVPYKMEWVRHHDKYEAPVAKPVAGGCCASKA